MTSIKLHKIPLLAKIAFAIVIGVIIGNYCPLWVARIVATFNDIFSQFLGFMIPLIIIGFVTPAISDIGSKAGKLLAVTAIMAYGATFVAGLLSYFTGVLTFPELIPSQMEMTSLDGNTEVIPYFSISMPPLMAVTTSLVLSFIIGLSTSFINGDSIKKLCNEFRDIVSLTINAIIIPFLPIYIFGIFLNMTVVGQVGLILECFFKIILVIFALHIFILVLQYCIAACFVKQNPFKMLRTMLPAYFTALGTQSSAATIPVTLRQTIKMNVNKDIAGFVIPLCATIHMSGSTLKIVACALALLIMHGEPYQLGTFIHFIGMLGITIIAAPGIPGGTIMASLGLLESILGFNETMTALMIALYIAMDSFGTACNVTGDGALAAIIGKIFKKRDMKAC